MVFVYIILVLVFQIVDLELPLDQNEKRRGFCFVSFQSEDVVKKVVEKRMQTIGGKEVKKSCTTILGNNVLRVQSI